MFLIIFTDEDNLSVEVAVDEIERLREVERTNNYIVKENMQTTGKFC